MTKSFGDGISWENFAYEVIEETNGDVNKIFFKYGQDKKKDEIIDRIKKHIKKNNFKLLDVGCNIGRWIDILNELGSVNYCGIDQSKDAIWIAKSYHPDKLFYNTFLWDIDFDFYFLNKFDIIFCNNVLQHNTIEEKRKILPLLRSALKEDGLGLLFINESTVINETMTQLTYEGWIRFIENYNFKFIESWQKNDIMKDECYLFKIV